MDAHSLPAWAGSIGCGCFPVPAPAGSVRDHPPSPSKARCDDRVDQPHRDPHDDRQGDEQAQQIGDMRRYAIDDRTDLIVVVYLDPAPGPRMEARSSRSTPIHINIRNNLNDDHFNDMSRGRREGRPGRRVPRGGH